jgi:hypothetical protein
MPGFFEAISARVRSWAVVGALRKKFRKTKLEILREPEYDDGTFRIYVRNVTDSPLHCGVSATDIGAFGDHPSVTILRMKGAEMQEMALLPPKKSRSVDVLRFDSDAGTLTLLGLRDRRPLGVVRRKLVIRAFCEGSEAKVDFVIQPQGKAVAFYPV